MSRPNSGTVRRMRAVYGGITRLAATSPAQACTTTAGKMRSLPRGMFTPHNASVTHYCRACTDLGREADTLGALQAQARDMVSALITKTGSHGPLPPAKRGRAIWTTVAGEAVAWAAGHIYRHQVIDRPLGVNTQLLSLAIARLHSGVTSPLQQRHRPRKQRHGERRGLCAPVEFQCTSRHADRQCAAHGPFQIRQRQRRPAAPPTQPWRASVINQSRIRTSRSLLAANRLYNHSPAQPWETLCLAP